MERHAFNTREQKNNEDTQTYVAALKILASTCEFGNLKDELIRDRLVCGIGNNNVSKQLLKEANLTLEKAIQTCTINEQSEYHSDKFQKHEVHEMRYRKPGKRPSGEGTSGMPTQRKCRNCGYEHEPRRCPAYNKRCHKCGKWNHFQSMCQSGQSQGSTSKKHIDNVGTAEYDESDAGYDEQDELSYVIDAVNMVDIFSKGEIFASIAINNQKHEVKIDTGAKCNVMSEAVMKQHKLESSLNTDNRIKLIAYGGTTFETIGTVSITCTHQDQKFDLLFHVTDKCVKTLLGLHDTLRMHLIQLSEHVHEIQPSNQLHNEILLEYADLFDNSRVGKLPVKYKMKLDETKAPVVRPPHKLPYALRDRVKRELDDMVKKEIITVVTEPTEWVSQMVAAKKKDKDEVRICIDPRDLNEALKRPHHPMRTVEEVVAKMPNAKFFAVIDAKTGFWQIPLEEQSSFYTTFNTPFGRYRFLRLPYGVKSGSEVFQRAMEELFVHSPCEIVVDDILIWGKSMEELKSNTHKVLGRAREVGLKLNAKKV